MIKTKKNCKVCQTIMGQPKKWEGRLAKRIYGSRWYTPSSDYSLAQVAQEYKDKFSYESLLNHAKKHQFLSEKDFDERHMRQTAKEAEKTLLKDAIQSSQVFDSVISQGMEELSEGNLKISTKDLLSAAKYKKDFELKEKGQQLALMEMVYLYASGEGDDVPGVRRDDVIEGEVSGESESSAESREERSRAFYESLAGDSTASRTN